MAAAILAGCSSALKAPSSPVPAQSAPTTPASSASATAPSQPAAAPEAPKAPGVLELTVKMTDYAFEPKDLVIPLGSRVKLTVVNAGQKSHDLNIIGGPGIEGDILDPGKSQVIEFTADKAGQFQVVCSQRGHKEKGMVATLTVK